MTAVERGLHPLRTGRAVTTGSAAFVRAVLVALAAALVFLALFEMAERLWLSALGFQELEWLHRLRGAAAAVLAAVVAGLMLLRSGTPLLVAGPLPTESADEDPPDRSTNRLHCARWFILMRWIAVIVGAAAVFIAVAVAHVLPREVQWRLSALIGGLTILNFAYAAHLRHRAPSVRFLVVQVYVDTLFLILLLHFSGGVENPLTPLLLLHVIIAGIVLGRVHSYVVAAVASVLFGVLAWGECTGALPHYTLTIFPHTHGSGVAVHAAQDPLYAGSLVVLQSVILFLVASFTTTLVERIRRDETRLTALAERARAQAQTLERALETTGTALCLSDRNLQPHWANRRWAEWEEEVPGLRAAISAPDSLAATALRDAAVLERELRAGDDDGAQRVLHLTSAPLRDRDRVPAYVVTIARDVTALYEAQRHAVRAERLAAVGELAGQVAHEVNNPIAIISAKARLLLRAPEREMSPRVGSEITKIAELADRVARIAQGLLSHCRPSPGVRTPVDVRLPLRRALTYVESRAVCAGVRVHDALGDALPLVCANAAELEQVFLNLALNALDAMPGGGELHVTATVDGSAGPDDAGALSIVVADSGPGIDPELRRRIFEPFMTTKGERGSGLGLSICQGIVRSHGGTITVESAHGRGTRVVVTLPVMARTLPLETAGTRA